MDTLSLEDQLLADEAINESTPVMEDTIEATTIEQRIKRIRQLRKNSLSTYVIWRPKKIELINEELELLRSRYKQADQITKDKYKNEAIGLKMILKELEV